MTQYTLTVKKKSVESPWSAEILDRWKFSHLAKILVTFKRAKKLKFSHFSHFQPIFFSTDIFFPWFLQTIDLGEFLVKTNASFLSLINT